jgi:hypothetical protein
MINSPDLAKNCQQTPSDVAEFVFFERIARVNAKRCSRELALSTSAALLFAVMKIGGKRVGFKLLRAGSVCLDS